MTQRFYNSKTNHDSGSASDSLGTEEHDLGWSINWIVFFVSLQNLNYTIMDSRAAHSPVFLVFPPDITMPEIQSGHVTGTTYDSSMPFPKLLATRMKILGVSKISPCKLYRGYVRGLTFVSPKFVFEILIVMWRYLDMGFLEVISLRWWSLHEWGIRTLVRRGQKAS